MSWFGVFEWWDGKILEKFVYIFYNTKMREIPEMLKNPESTWEFSLMRENIRKKLLQGLLYEKRRFFFDDFYSLCLPEDNLNFNESIVYLISASWAWERGTSYKTKQFINRTLETLGLQNNVKLKNIRVDDIVKAWQQLDSKECNFQWVMKAIDKFKEGSMPKIFLEELLGKFYKRNNNNIVKR